MKPYVTSVVIMCVLALTVLAGERRTWSDISGKHQTEAEMVSVDSAYVTLKKDDGTTLHVPIEKLSESDRAFVQSKKKATGVVTPAISVGTTNANSSEITTFKELQRVLEKQREAYVSLSLLEGFLATDSIDAQEREHAKSDMPRWQRLADQGASRVWNKWVSPAEFKQMKETEIRLIKEAHRLIDVKSDEVAKQKFLEASKANPQGVRANFYLGLLNALIAKSPQYAETHFQECIRRSARENDLLVGVRLANYVAALNNFAVTEVRRRRYDDAIGAWRKALEIAPYTPELVQNLGLMSKLAETATFVRIPKEQRASAENLYAKAAVQYNLARFDYKVAWLVMPYIDTLDGSMDESGDEELVNVGWCTGFAIAPGYVLTSRYPVVDADRIVAHQGANVFEIPAGKVVAISKKSNLALLKIDGLGGKQFRLSSKATAPAQDVTISGYREPGFGADTLQSRKATIVEVPNVLRHVDTSVYTSLGPLAVATFDYRNMILHDAILTAGMEGAPLLDQRGAVVGIHLGNRPSFGAFGSKYSMAEPSQYAISFLKPILSELAISDANDSVKVDFDSQAQRELVENSLFQLAIQKRAPRLAWSHRIEELHRLQRQGDWKSYEDKTCMACNGTRNLRCTNSSCAQGHIRHKERELKHKDSNTGTEIWGYRTVVEDCPVCHGKGTITCTYCDSNGNDKMLGH